jgi:N12 class adenine-specific DNA methylase
MTEEEKAKERLEKIKEAKRRWWHSEKGQAWKNARKAKEAALDAREDPKKPEHV